MCRFFIVSTRFLSVLRQLGFPDSTQDKENQVCDNGSYDILEEICRTEMPGWEEDLHGFLEKAEGAGCNQSDPQLPAHSFKKEDDCDAYDKVFD